MGQIRDTSEAGLKLRMRQRLTAIGKDMTWLAEELGEDYKNVQRWISGKTKMPAAFVARYASVVPVDERWLLTGEGTPERLTESEAIKTVQEIERLIQRMPTDWLRPLSRVEDENEEPGASNDR